jgi:hypothetical protein
VPPRYAYWTIIAGGLPTAFRAADREELLPTFQRIREKHPDAEMKWFARGKLWDSQEEARHGHAGNAADRSGGQKSRDRNWRPGGEHRDPRQKFVDAQKQRNARTRNERWQRKNASPRKPWPRAQGTEEPQQPPRPRGPNREPRPNEDPEPTPPPRPDVPATPVPGPPERGRRPQRRFQPRDRFRKGPRR